MAMARWKLLAYCNKLSEEPLFCRFFYDGHILIEKVLLILRPRFDDPVSFLRLRHTGRCRSGLRAFAPGIAPREFRCRALFWPAVLIGTP